MSAPQRFINKFTKGMRRGLDPAQLNNESYDYSLNGSFIFNDDGTWAWENTKGTKIAFKLAADYANVAATDYKPIGSCYVNGTLIVFSTNNKEDGSASNGEIGIVKQDQYDTYIYKTAFNDKYDPYGDSLNFSLQFNIRSHAIQENNIIERVYWNDDRNEPRVFNFIAGLTFSPRPYNAPYPSWYSVHGMNLMPDLTWGLMKFTKNIAGTLLSGERQYAYRYIHQTGYASPWSNLTQFIFLTKDTIDAGNWTNYQMSASGLTTTKGHQLEIKFLDQRFQKVEVACLFWETDTGAQNASIVFSGDIPPIGSPASIIVTHVSDGGVEIATDELVQKFFNIKNAKTQGIHYDNFYHMGNIETYGDLPIETEDITVRPYTRLMLSDQKGATTEIPLTHQNPVKSQITTKLFEGSSVANETYEIDSETGADYINYKGTQWTHLFKGYFRRETYPFAIVLWNRKGQPLFAQHITDYTFPEQYNDDFTDARVTGVTTGNTGEGNYPLTDYIPGSAIPVTDDIVQGNYVCLNIMGIRFSNIKLPAATLFDSSGKLQVSGFSIVRMDRVASIVGQGLLMNTVRKLNSGCGDEFITRPLITSWNYLKFDGTNPDYAQIGQTPEPCIINARGNQHTFECPDFMTDQTLFLKGSTNDKLRLVGACVPRYQPDVPPAVTPPFGFVDAPANNQIRLYTGATRKNYHYYNKNYLTPRGGDYSHIWDGATPFAGAGFGHDSTVDKLFADARNIDGVNGTDFREQATIKDYMDMFAENPDDSYTAITHHHSILITSDLTTCSLRYSNYHDVYYITNYLRPVAASQVTQVSLENRVYYNIGHFVPINATTLAQAFDGTNYIFNDVEVWGGDCFADFFAYCRLVPAYFYENGEHVAKCDYYSNHAIPDYSIGLIFPLESKFNQSMRSNDEYAKVGSRPLSTYCNGTPGFPNGTTTDPSGIYYAADDNQKEEVFDVNKVLQAHDLVSLYNAKKTLLNPDITDFPLMEVHSLQKFYGENFDNYRKFLVNNYQFANGAFGEITSIENLLGGNLYVLQRQALGRIRFNERQLVETTSGTVNTGTGVGYAGHDYITTEFGTQHQFSVVNSGKSIYFADAEKGKWLRFGQDGLNNLSDQYDARWMRDKMREYWYVKDVAGLIEQPYYDNPSYAGGIHGVFDFKNNSVILTFTKRKESRKVAAGLPIIEVGIAETIEYNELTNTFQTYHSFTPNWYMSMKQNYLSLNPIGTNQAYVHDEGKHNEIYGTYQNSLLRFVVNPQNIQPKTFDNGLLEVVGDVGIFKSAKGTTNITAQQTVLLNSNTDDRPIYREGRYTYPIMAKGQSVRLRGQYLTLEYEIEPVVGADKVVRLTQHQTIYRLSPRN